MSFTMDLASSLLRSPGKKRIKGRRGKTEENVSELSPTRVTDFPGMMEEENEACFFCGSEEVERPPENLESVVRNLSLATLHGPHDICATSMDITPINPSQRRKQWHPRL